MVANHISEGPWKCLKATEYLKLEGPFVVSGLEDVILRMRGIQCLIHLFFQQGIQLVEHLRIFC